MKITKPLSADLTPPVLFLRGEFSLWDYTIPFFSTVIEWDFARDKFKLIEELSAAYGQDWSIAELFQRDLDWSRIDAELVKYLRNASHPQFFNSLTIALLPLTGDTFGTKYGEPQDLPKIDAPGLEETQHVVGGVQVQYFEGSACRAGMVRWDMKTIAAVAVDGQHRLAAMKKLGTKAPAQNRARTAVPAILLVPDAAFGLVEPKLPEGVVRTQSTLRRIFIDINKHAREIPAARQILLDDQDVHRVCVRELIDDRLTADPAPGRIPLAMVDWISDKRNRIETGPFVTTVLLVEDFVREVLSEPRLRFGPASLDEEDAEALEDERQRVEDWLCKTFSPNEEQLSELMSQVNRCYAQQVNLTWLPEHLATLAELYDRAWRPSMSAFFRELTPYRRLWEYRSAHDLMRPDFVSLYAALEIEGGTHGERRAAIIKDEIQKARPGWQKARDYTEHLRVIDEEIKRGSWAFMVVFQRALFRSLARFADGHPWADSEAPRLDLVGQWLKATDALLSSPLGQPDHRIARGKQEFWRGIGKKADGTVDYTKAGVERIDRWVSLWAYMYVMTDEIPKYVELQDSESIAEATVSRMLTKPVVKGFERLSAATLQLEAQDPRVKTAAEAELQRHYDYMRTKVLECRK